MVLIGWLVTICAVLFFIGSCCVNSAKVDDTNDKLATQARMAQWNSYAQAHHLDTMTYEEAATYEDRDIRRAILAAKAGIRTISTGADGNLYNIVNPTTHWEHYGPKNQMIREVEE